MIREVWVSKDETITAPIVVFVENGLWVIDTDGLTFTQNKRIMHYFRCFYHTFKRDR